MASFLRLSSLTRRATSAALAESWLGEQTLMDRLRRFCRTKTVTAAVTCGGEALPREPLANTLRATRAALSK